MLPISCHMIVIYLCFVEYSEPFRKCGFKPYMTPELTARQRWMGLLARSNENDFNKLWQELELEPNFVVIKPAQQGLVMVRGRAGGSGHPFNMGEITVTRCSVRLDNGIVGHGYVSGRRMDFSQKAAIVDALMQDEEFNERLENNLISKLEDLEKQRREDMSKKVAATKVDFFTMVRGED